MRLEKIDLNLFVVFDALYRERSVSRAAMALNLTQPAVSNALARLRASFDDQLFVRVKGGVAPTPVADTVVPDVREALALLKRSIEVSAGFEPATSDKVFKLGMNDLAEALVLPKLRLHLREVAPGVSVTSYYVDRHSGAEELKSGLIDLMVDAPLLDLNDLDSKALSSLPYVVAMRPDHPLAGRTLSVDEYLASEHIHVSSRRKGAGQMDLALHAMGYDRTVKMRVQNFLVAARITEETDLLWTVPKILADSLPLHTVALPFRVEPMRWFLFWHKQAKDDPSNIWMRETIAALLDRST
jgi:DNA-binding transcriptional LysR family regulator